MTSSIANDDDAASVCESTISKSESLYLCSGEQRERTNSILSEINISPLKSQSTMELEKQSEGSQRRLLSKLARATRNFRGILRKII